MYTKMCPVCQINFETKQHNQQICSNECRHQWNFILSIKRCEERVHEHMDIYLKREYGANKRSYRSLMKDLGCTNRTITKMLDWFNIPIRRGSEAVKTQWTENEKRRKEQDQTFGNLHRGKPSSRRISNEILKERLDKRGLILIKRWIEDGYTNFEYQCKVCNHIDKSILKNIRTCTCSNCLTVSHGEETIKAWLNQQGLSYQAQYKIDECKNILPLPFDIAVFNKLNELCYLIEYDGEQHFHSVERFGGDQEFEKIKKRDAIKSAFCKENNLKLIRIPYFEFDNIHNILRKEITIQAALPI